jgi:hypothetical protein
MAASTITRIEGGTVDPTVGTLRRLMHAADQELNLTATPTHRDLPPALADLTSAWNRSPVGTDPTWTRLRAFLDQLARHPAEVEAAITTKPVASGSAPLDALLAGIADKLADDHGLTRPAWTAVPRLQTRWQTPGTPRMQAAALRQTPPQLRERGLSVSKDSLWRESNTVVV